MENMQCLNNLTFEYKLAMFIWGVWCLVSVPIFIKQVHEINKLKTILKYKDFLGSDKE